MIKPPKPYYFANKNFISIDWAIFVRSEVLCTDWWVKCTWWHKLKTCSFGGCNAKHQQHSTRSKADSLQGKVEYWWYFVTIKTHKKVLLTWPESVGRSLTMTNPCVGVRVCTRGVCVHGAWRSSQSSLAVSRQRSKQMQAAGTPFTRTGRHWTWDVFMCLHVRQCEGMRRGQMGIKAVKDRTEAKWPELMRGWLPGLI